MAHGSCTTCYKGCKVVEMSVCDSSDTNEQDFSEDSAYDQQQEGQESEQEEVNNDGDGDSEYKSRRNGIGDATRTDSTTEHLHHKSNEQQETTVKHEGITVIRNKRGM